MLSIKRPKPHQCIALRRRSLRRRRLRQPRTHHPRSYAGCVIAFVAEEVGELGECALSMAAAQLLVYAIPYFEG